MARLLMFGLLGAAMILPGAAFADGFGGKFARGSSYAAPARNAHGARPSTRPAQLSDRRFSAPHWTPGHGSRGYSGYRYYNRTYLGTPSYPYFYTPVIVGSRYPSQYNPGLDHNYNQRFDTTYYQTRQPGFTRLYGNPPVVVYRAPVPPPETEQPDGRTLVLDRDGNCYEQKTGDDGTRLLIELPAEACDWPD